jgi:glycine cleavage system transcriptional repressor
MSTEMVLTLTGPDRVGIVEEVTSALLGLGGNVGASRMARLGGEFAILMHVALSDAAHADFERSFAHLVEQGYRVTIAPAASSAAQPHPDWIAYRIEVQGADHEGIVHEIARCLSEFGINIESMETWTTDAPTTGTTLFHMTAEVAVSPTLSGTDWEAEIAEAGRRANVDVAVLPVPAG